MIPVWHGTADVTAWERRPYGAGYVTDQWTIMVSLHYRLEDSTDNESLQCALCYVHDHGSV